MKISVSNVQFEFITATPLNGVPVIARRPHWSLDHTIIIIRRILFITVKVGDESIFVSCWKMQSFLTLKFVFKLPFVWICAFFISGVRNTDLVLKLVPDAQVFQKALRVVRLWAKRALLALFVSINNCRRSSHRHKIFEYFDMVWLWFGLWLVL